MSTKHTVVKFGFEDVNVVGFTNKGKCTNPTFHIMPITDKDREAGTIRKSFQEGDVSIIFADSAAIRGLILDLSELLFCNIKTNGN